VHPADGRNVQPFGRLFNLARFGSEAGQLTMWSSRSAAAI
jgi:hypothetical protein